MLKCSTFLFIAMCPLPVGCGAQPGIDPNALRSEPLADVVRENHLDMYHSWPAMNVPPDADPEITYFMDRGNLVLRYSGDPATVRTAEFWPSEESPEERYHEANAAWGEWVKAHTRE